MKSKQGCKESKGVNAKKPKKERGFEQAIQGLAKSQQLPDEMLKMFNQLGLGTPRDDCSGNCITCKKKVSCETYKKIRDCFAG